MKARDYNVSGLYLRQYLTSLRKICGPQYPRLLERVGLGQYVDKYPPPTTEVAAKGAQLIELYRSVEAQIGTDLFHLFTSNLGREFGHNMSKVELLKGLATTAQANPTQANLIALINKVSELNYATLNEKVEVQAGQQANEIIIIYRECVTCAERPASQPACVGLVAFYKQLLLDLAKIKVHVEEIRCGAVTGEFDCFISVQLPPAPDKNNRTS
jgi:predicted hydrocarbon binding protein